MWPGARRHRCCRSAISPRRSTCGHWFPDRSSCAQLELRDVTVVLESNRKGENNWTFGDPNAPPEPEPNSDEGLKKLPVAFHNATLQNLLVTYRAAGEEERRARIESLTVQPGTGELLAIQGKGSLDDYAAAISGEAGPLESLVAGRDIRMAIKASLGNLRMDLKGAFGRLDPLDGADLKLTIDNPDVGTMFRKLRVPVLADGPMHVQATMADAGKRTRIELRAKAGDLTANISGSLAMLGLRDSELDIKAQALDAARLAAAFDVRNIPAEKLDDRRARIHHAYEAKTCGTQRPWDDQGFARRPGSRCQGQHRGTWIHWI